MIGSPKTTPFFSAKKPPPYLLLEDQHAVAVAEEVVLFADSVGVGGEDQFPAPLAASEGADQHKQRGLRQMEVREKASDNLKFIAWAEEDAGLAGVGFKRSPSEDLGAVLKRACSGGAGSDNAPTRVQRGVYRFSSSGREGVTLSMKVDVGEVFGANRLEGAEANVEGEGFDLDAVLLEFREDFGGKVEAGSGGCGASDFVGEDGLVAVAILRAVVAVDVGGERHVAYFVEDGVEVWGWGEAQGAFAEVGSSQNFGFEQGLWFGGRVE